MDKEAIPNANYAFSDDVVEILKVIICFMTVEGRGSCLNNNDL